LAALQAARTDTSAKRGEMKALPERLDDLYDELGQHAGYYGVIQIAADRIRELETALRMFQTQWNACGANSDFGRYFQNVKLAVDKALTPSETNCAFCGRSDGQHDLAYPHPVPVSTPMKTKVVK
jgi:hypothetical protein